MAKFEGDAADRCHVVHIGVLWCVTDEKDDCIVVGAAYAQR
jgi:hypothetical protein